MLVRDERPAVWLLEEDFTGPDGVPRRRRGIVARAARSLRERSRSSPRADVLGPEGARLRLLRATRTKPSPIFMLHHGTAPPPTGEPALQAKLDGVVSRLWRIDDAAEAERVLAGVEGPP